MSTIADVAARAGVSKATASRALSGRGYVSEETRKRVADAADDLSYVAHSSATSLATGRTGTIAVIVPTLERWFFTELVAGIQDALIDADLDLALYDVREGSRTRERVFDDVLPRRRFDGLIAAGIQPSANEIDRLLQLARPVVGVGPCADDVSGVSIDDRGAARIATEHLLDLGHRDVAFVGTTPGSGTSLGDALRLDGYCEAMRAAGAEERVAPGESSMSGGYAAAAELLADRRSRPTALVGVCDEAAIGAIIAARRLGIAVPAQLSVIGVDDHRDAEMFALTSIRQRPREQGAQAVSILLSALEDPGRPIERIRATSSLVMRSSTVPPTP